MFFVIVTSLLTLVSAYIGIRLLPALSLEPWASAVAILILSLPPLSAAAALVLRSLTASALARRITWAASLTLGWVSWLFVLTLLREPLLGISHWLLPASTATQITRLSAQAVPTLALIATVLGVFGALGRPRIRRVTIPLVELQPALQGFTIVQLSDVHVGQSLGRRFVQRIVDRVNTLDPDLIVITGDLVDGTVAQLRDAVAPLAALRSRHGVFFVTGNHEYYSGATAWIAHLESLGIRVLSNEHVLIRRADAALVLAGIPDPVGQAFDPAARGDPHSALRAAPDGVRPRILLSHRPGSARAALRAGFDLQLSGHTHGGQFWPWNLVVRAREPLSIGLDRLETLWVYTSRGTGFWGPPQRLGAPSEITLLQLCASPRQRRQRSVEHPQRVAAGIP